MTYEDAIILAVKAHAGQTRWNGEPYVLHPLRVANQLNMYGDRQLKMAAVLHDVLEDTEVTHDELARLFSARVASLVALLTRDKTSRATYGEFIQNIIASNSWDAMRIKLADIEDNLSDLPTDHGLRKRYEKAKAALTDALEGW